MPPWCLRLIVLIEARAAPRLHTVEGLWRRSTRTRPGRITDFIRAERLLPQAEIGEILRTAPTELLRFQDAAALVPSANGRPWSNGSPTLLQGRPQAVSRQPRGAAPSRDMCTARPQHTHRLCRL